MKIVPNKIRRFQMGGEMAPEEAAPDQMGGAPEEAPAGPEQGGGDPIMQIAQMAAQALQNQDCQMAMQVCEIFLQMVQQSQGAAEPEPAGEPVFKAGGILVRRKRK